MVDSWIRRLNDNVELALPIGQRVVEQSCKCSQGYGEQCSEQAHLIVIKLITPNLSVKNSQLIPNKRKIRARKEK